MASHGDPLDGHRLDGAAALARLDPGDDGGGHDGRAFTGHDERAGLLNDSPQNPARAELPDPLSVLKRRGDAAKTSGNIKKKLA